MGKFEFWMIAYRKRGEKTLMEDQKSPFQTIPNTWRYWCADPHLFSRDGRTYVFAELYDRVLRRGVIGVCELREEGATPWKVVLKMPFHLSYPHVFREGDKIYMIPESYVGREIALYEAVSFPYRWEKVAVLRDDYVAVDTTPFVYDQKKWVFTYHIEEKNELELFSFDGDRFSGDPLKVEGDSENQRPAGKLFFDGEALIRPAQDCSRGYGCALNFYKVEEVGPDFYRESLVRKILPSQIRSDFTKKGLGIHTYNLSEKYEVVDLKYEQIDLWFYVMRPIWFLYRKLKRK